MVYTLEVILFDDDNDIKVFLHKNEKTECVDDSLKVGKTFFGDYSVEKIFIKKPTKKQLTKSILLMEKILREKKRREVIK